MQLRVLEYEAGWYKIQVKRWWGWHTPSRTRNKSHNMWCNRREAIAEAEAMQAAESIKYNFKPRVVWP